MPQPEPPFRPPVSALALAQGPPSLAVPGLVNIRPATASAPSNMIRWCWVLLSCLLGAAGSY